MDAPRYLTDGYLRLSLQEEGEVVERWEYIARSLAQLQESLRYAHPARTTHHRHPRERRLSYTSCLRTRLGR